MRNPIKCKKAKFWLEDGVLFCDFIPEECICDFKEEFLNEFLETIDRLSNGSYFPILIDLRQLNNAQVFKVVRMLAKNTELKSAILSKSFVVNSFFLQFMLVVCKRIQDPVIPNKVFQSYENALKYSLETNYIFNT